MSKFFAPVGGHMEEKMQIIMGLAMVFVGIIIIAHMGNALLDFFIVFFIIAGVCFAGGNKRF